jgi:putative heme degradation protein
MPTAPRWKRLARHDRRSPVLRPAEKYNLSRQQAFRLVSDDLACRVANDALPQLLETMRQRATKS